MLVTELGISMLVSLGQTANAELPILVTELGISMLVSPLQYANALSPMLVTELGIIVFLHPAINVLLDFSMIALQLPRES